MGEPLPFVVAAESSALFLPAPASALADSKELTLVLPSLRIRHLERPVPVVQGGMGVGVSLAPLAGAVSRCGGLGTLSSACLDRLVSRRLGRKLDSRQAAAVEVAEARELGGVVAINIMVALDGTYDASVLGALDGGVDAIVSGAGLPLRLPAVIKGHPRAEDVALVPIVSSGRALRLLCLRWRKLGRLPDAVVVEGPLAGGHLGWKTAEDAEDPAHALDRLVPEVVEAAAEFGGFPVIAAGGVYTHEDVVRMIGLGAAGVQLGTRFLATVESSASAAYKQAVIESTDADILVAQDPGSPCGLPFRVLACSPMFRETTAGRRQPRCDKGYLMGSSRCPALEGPSRYFCICNGLLSSAGYNPEEEPPLYTVGATASRVDRLMTVAELMDELRGEPASHNRDPERRAAAAA